MLTKTRFALTSRQFLLFTMFLVLAGFLIGVCAELTRLTKAAEAPKRRFSAMEIPEETDESEDDEESEEMDDRDKPAKIKQTANRRVQEYEEEEEDDQSLMCYDNGFGAIGRLSHLAGKTFGRNDSITPLEVMPYLLTDEHFLFADVRGFVTNRSQAGGNLGVGYRHLMDQYNAWAGASLWYDADQSTSKLYQQIGLSFEGLIDRFEVRSNVYLPVTSSQFVSNSIGNSSIVGNQLFYSPVSNNQTPLRGVDAEVGYSWPVLDRHVVRGFVGAYHFEGGSASSVNGFKARVEGVINNAVTAQVLYTHDNLYGDNAMVGLSIQYPFGQNHPASNWTRNTPSPYRYVERNYNVIVAETQTTSAMEAATDPTTNKPYVIEQVYAPTSGPVSSTPNGTAANPFYTIAQAQAAGGDVILVQSGSVLNQAITLTPGQHLIGIGNFSESLATSGGGFVKIPNLLQSGTATTPVIQNVTGTAVTLASNTDFGGFNITGATGNSISGNGITGVTLHDLTIVSNAGNAITLTNSSNVSILNTHVTSTSSQPAISLVNNAGAITLQGINVNSQNGTGLYASNDTNLQVNGGAIAATNATAVDIESSSVNASLNSVSANGGAIGIKLANSTGNFTIQGNGSAGSGGTIQNTTSAGMLINSFGNTNLNWVNFTNNAVGIQSTGSTQLDLANLKITGSTGYAIESTNDTSFTLGSSTLTSNGSTGNGTVLVEANTVGTFTSVIGSNTITDKNGTAIQFLTQAGGVGATLNTQISSNTMSGYNAGSSLMGINWNGPATVNVCSNTFNAYGANMTAISLQDTSTTSVLAGTITSNAIYFIKTAATSGTGISVVDGQSGQTSTVTSTLSITSNGIQFQENGGTALRFGLYDTTTATISGNVVSDQVGGGTGMLFDSVSANSNLTITGNVINLLASDPTTHRGFVFSQVSPNVIFTTPTGSLSNVITNASSGQTLVIPAGTGTGGILIGGHLTTLPQ